MAGNLEEENRQVETVCSPGRKDALASTSRNGALIPATLAGLQDHEVPYGQPSSIGATVNLAGNKRPIT